MPTKTKPSIAALLKRAILRATPDQKLEMVIADMIEQRDMLEPHELLERIHADIAIRRANEELLVIRTSKKRRG